MRGYGVRLSIRFIIGLGFRVRGSLRGEGFGSDEMVGRGVGGSRGIADDTHLGTVSV